ncbi:transposase, partial [Pseudomonas sp. NY15364]|uniref:transposase n=1 Tax=Pseudomonas sp. NY15364 TaxID=3400353 RepID=UPI003A898988
ARQDFTYDPATDSFQCPAGKTLSLKQLNRGTRLYAAHAKDCGNCPLKAKCTQAQRRHISRHPNEEAFARMEKRLETHPEMMGRR